MLVFFSASEVIRMDSIALLTGAGNCMDASVPAEQQQMIWNKSTSIKPKQTQCATQVYTYWSVL